jgi:hypothetical protein
LELVKLFKGMLGEKMSYLEREREKFEIGVAKLIATEEMVAGIEQEL